MDKSAELGFTRELLLKEELLLYRYLEVLCGWGIEKGMEVGFSAYALKYPALENVTQYR